VESAASPTDDAADQAACFAYDAVSAADETVVVMDNPVPDGKPVAAFGGQPVTDGRSGGEIGCRGRLGSTRRCSSRARWREVTSAWSGTWLSPGWRSGGGSTGVARA